MPYLRFLVALLALAACDNSSTSSKTTANNPAPVYHKGALKNMMHEGDLSAQADLADLKNIPHLYALGALENLKGELQIWDSQPFHTIVENKQLTVDQSFDKKAALLVYASVPKWKTIEVPKTVTTYQELEKYVAKAAQQQQLNTDQPFAFMLTGTFESLDWHVIDWKEGDNEHSHEKHIQSGLQGTLRQTNAEILGFYSNAHHAIFTHHTTNMHLHVKTVDNKIAGHVDDLTLGEEMLLRLPDNH
jgi:acetolactate decarboxylase